MPLKANYEHLYINKTLQSEARDCYESEKAPRITSYLKIKTETNIFTILYRAYDPSQGHIVLLKSAIDRLS